MLKACQLDREAHTARHAIYMWLAHSTFSPNKAGPTLSQYHKDVPVANTQCGCSNQLSLHSYQLSIGSDQISMGSYQALRSSQLAKQLYHCLLSTQTTTQ